MRYFDCHADTLTEIKKRESLTSSARDLDLQRGRGYLYADFCSVERPGEDG